VSLFIIALLVDSYQKADDESQATDSYILAPKIDDIYFLDFRKLSDNLRPREKYRLAKVVDVTGEVITFRYGNVFFWQKQSLIDSIRYGQITYSKYFEPKRHDFNLSQLKVMRDNGAIFKVKRPELNVLYGNYVNMPVSKVSSQKNHLYVPGKRDNLAGLGFLKSTYIENNYAQAFDHFSQSAKEGYAQGQVNLAQMYINGQHIEKDFDKALHWLKVASLQSDKSAILKYVIVCQQVSYCDLGDFYQELTISGVNIKVREHDFKLSTSDDD
jgi:TPR repeat protein